MYSNKIPLAFKQDSCAKTKYVYKHAKNIRQLHQ